MEQMTKTYTGHVARVFDMEAAEKLWNISHQWLKNPPK
jgi:hypothetical protein